MSKMQEKVNLIFSECDSMELLEQALKVEPQQILKMLLTSSLRGRGGAGFLTSLKWKFASEADGNRKFVVANADEGEPGTFKDREILDKVPCKVLAGMAICAHTIGAREGYIYLRGEYNYMKKSLQQKLDEFNDKIKNMLDFTISIKSGSGAYVCGEETALIESMEGKRGEPRNKPPYPVTEGYLGFPTVVNNVETLVYVAMIMKHGAAHFASLGTEKSKGAKVFSVSGDTPIPGIYELEMGMNLAEFVELFGDGDTKAVQVGGASGFCVPRRKFAETIIGFEGIPTGGSMMLFNSSRSMYNVLHNYLEFFCEESCGQCTPCRVGCQQLRNGIEAVKQRKLPPSHLDVLSKMTRTMKIASKCGLGQSVPNSFNSIVTSFKEEIIY
ncbi:MAG: NADH-quinone oxidoreductase subunit E [Deltaproteobacteria bacterium]|nr:NADH-quinone oxidoreductase subunit E [Deltaproteobacteria bacterium]